jgi:hypothetical protein
VTALDTTAFSDYADQRYAEAQQIVDSHVTSAYTGICLGCGRPGPCDELRAARELAARYARPGVPAPRTAPPPVAVAVTSAAGTMDDLRDAALAIQAATDRAAGQLDGVHWLNRRLAGWQSALTDGWQALGLVHAGLAEARRLPDAPGGSAAEILTALRAARADADRAAALAAGVRLRLTVAEDRLRRTGKPAAVVAARRWAAAIARLDLVAARLAVGSQALDGYAAVLAGAGPAPAPPPSAAACTRADIAPGATAAGRLITGVRRRERPSFWAKVRHELRKETRR